MEENHLEENLIDLVEMEDSQNKMKLQKTKEDQILRKHLFQKQNTRQEDRG